MRCKNCGHVLIMDNSDEVSCTTGEWLHLNVRKQTMSVLCLNGDEVDGFYCACRKPEPEASRGEQVIYEGDIKLDSPEGGNPSRVNHRPCKDARNPESFCESCYHNKEAHTFGGCAYCNCKGFEEKKKEILKCPVCGGDYGHVELNRQLREERLEIEKKKEGK